MDKNKSVDKCLGDNCICNAIYWWKANPVMFLPNGITVTNPPPPPEMAMLRMHQRREGRVKLTEKW